MMRTPKKKTTSAMLAVMLCFPFITGSDYIWRDRISRGADRSTYRCDEGVVSQGDLMRDVLDKCGEPMAETRIQLEPYIVWTYSDSGGEYIVYLGFTHERLNRIYVTRCWDENPHCQ